MVEHAFKKLEDTFILTQNADSVFQNRFPNPSSQDQYIGLDVGQAVLRTTTVLIDLETCESAGWAGTYLQNYFLNLFGQV